MNCPKCGRANESDKKFCVYCGSQLIPVQEPSRQSTMAPPPFTGKSNKKVMWLMMGIVGLVALCVISGLLIGGGVWIKDYLMTPEQRVEKALQGDTAREVNDQLQKIPKNTKGRDKVVKHYFDVSKREALQSDTYPLIAETINEFRQNGLDVKELEEHASKVMERQEQEYAKQQQEEARRKRMKKQNKSRRNIRI